MRTATHNFGDWVSPPGRTIQDILEERHTANQAAAEAFGWSEGELEALLEGKTPITPALAERIATVIGGKPDFWLRRETHFRAALQHVDQLQARQEQRWLRSLPMRQMVRFHWIAPESVKNKYSAALAFFKVSSFPEWQEKYEVAIDRAAFRTSRRFPSNPAAVAAWLRKGELDAESLHTSPWSATEFRDALPKLRLLTKVKDPALFLPKLQKECSKFGVAVQIVRAPNGCTASGATRFLSPSKALLLLSFRYLSDDHFWFTFFHEAAHLLLHGQEGVFVEGIGRQNSKYEDEANTFAADTLIPPAERTNLFALRKDSREIIRFAYRVGVSPGIVVGQLQHMGLLRQNELNFLKRRFKWTDN